MRYVSKEIRKYNLLEATTLKFLPEVSLFSIRLSSWWRNGQSSSDRIVAGFLKWKREQDLRNDEQHQQSPAKQISLNCCGEMPPLCFLGTGGSLQQRGGLGHPEVSCASLAAQSLLTFLFCISHLSEADQLFWESKLSSWRVYELGGTRGRKAGETTGLFIAFLYFCFQWSYKCHFPPNVAGDWGTPATEKVHVAPAVSLFCAVLHLFSWRKHLRAQ